MLAEGFLEYRGFRWLWFSLFLVGTCLVLYFDRDPLGPPPGGGTTAGYVLGTIATIIILVLMWLGIRKRMYNARLTTLKGTLAAHVWLGLSLIIIVPLHCGFQFGSNVHTWAYILMLVVIFSGVVGTVIYVRYPKRVMAHRGGGSAAELLEQISQLSREIQFLSKDRSDQFLYFLDLIDPPFTLTVVKSLMNKIPALPSPADLSRRIVDLPPDEQDEGRELIRLVREKIRIYKQIAADLRVLVLFRAWLYIHLPLSFGLVAAVGVHIISVLAYR